MNIEDAKAKASEYQNLVGKKFMHKGSGLINTVTEVYPFMDNNDINESAVGVKLIGEFGLGALQMLDKFLHDFDEVTS